MACRRLILVGSLLALLPAAADGQSFIRGDADANGLIDVSDELFMITHIFLEADLPVPPPFDRADTNDNEIVNYTDIRLLESLLFQASPIPPSAPYPFPGVDPDDELGTYGSVQPGFETRLVVDVVTPATIELAVEIDSPVPVRGVEFTLELASGLDGAAATLTPNPEAGSSFSHALLWEEPLLHVLLQRNLQPIALPADGRIATLTIPHDGSMQPCPGPGAILWRPEAQVLGTLRRATIASDVHQDHHPAGSVDPCSQAVFLPWFLRADCNADSRIDLADAVRALEGLFAGVEIPCASACDANDDGQVDCADPIHLLAHLFAGGPDPAPPFPDCGGDATLDGLACDPAPECR